ncbi:STAS domain-containing protein [Nonomuraea solani]|uniref:STAS domain-containing protein n=1 Tax=Nonomuraea solani TaxID=1144553 RepID=A0A1H5W1N5_9ACTN|nr:STAS domain-containing protein [Nonomuraea solani]SEF93370.1 STAS domain-containing protein [Nonomuraea solani]
MLLISRLAMGTMLSMGPCGPERPGELRLESERLLYTDTLLWVGLVERPGRSELRLIGEIDFSNGAAVAGILATARGIAGRLVVDLDRLTFIDVAGIRVLATFCEESAVLFTNVPDSVSRVSELLELPPLR